MKQHQCCYPVGGNQGHWTLLICLILPLLLDNYVTKNSTSWGGFEWLLCISTSKQVLRTPFASRNKFLTLKHIFAYFSVLKCSVSNGKSCFCIRKSISTSKARGAPVCWSKYTTNGLKMELTNFSELPRFACVKMSRIQSGV